jgi:hypothetical protein
MSVGQRTHGVVLCFFALFVSVEFSLHTAVAADATCIACHKDQATKHKTSVHGLGGMTCVECHGGDPTIPDETAHLTDDFKRPSDKTEIATLCASCHSDVKKMNPFGLPTDQLERFKTSKHGELLFGKGDKNVATCTDCHTAHDIHKSKAPNSATHPTRIADTCARCHSDAKLMAQYKIPTDQAEKYKTSHHAHLLYEKGDLSAPTCVTCHGNHGATPPGIVEVGQVCGKCHGRQRDLFAKSPHFEASKVGVFSECVSCHGNHAIKKASIELFEQACSTCHANDKNKLPMMTRDAIVRLLHEAKGSYERAEKLVHNATVRGLATDDEQLLLQEVKTQITQLEALQHTLAIDSMRPVATRASELVEATEQGIAQLESVETWKRRALLPIWLFLMAMAVIFWLKRRQIERQEKS